MVAILENLNITIKKQWFEMIELGIKTEEYRELKPYYFSRLLQCYKDLKTKNSKIFCKKANCIRCITESDGGEFINFKFVTFKNGYSKNSPSLKFEIENIKIATGNVSWGAEPGKLYFVIKLVKLIN